MELEYIYIGIPVIILMSLAITLFVLYGRARHDSAEKGEIIEKITAEYNEAVECDKNKTEFFSDIIHELKTPISIILGAIQLLEAKMKNPGCEQKNCIKNHSLIKLNCYRLLRLTTNLLDFARMDAGYLRLNLSNCNLTYLVEEITQSVVPYAGQKKVDIVFDTQSEEIIIAADIEKIERIVLNLLSNAIKFTHQGGVIGVYTYLNENRACISVKDNGIGIPEQKQKEIFERFQQVGSAASRENEGSGIGLSIVSSFVKMHDGNISIISKQGEGSEFIVELPVRKLEKEETEEIAAPEIHDKITEAANIEFSGMKSAAL